MPAKIIFQSQKNCCICARVQRQAARSSVMIKSFISERELAFTFAICCRSSVWLSVVCRL